MKLESKYNIGDTVFAAECESITVRIQCPYCLGAREWKVTAPNGEVFVMDCPACYLAWEATGQVSESRIVPITKRLTIGRVTYEAAYEKDGEMEFRYMCEETGIGTGRTYSEPDLFSKEPDAYNRAIVKTNEVKANTDETLERQKVSRMKDAHRRLRRKPCAACEGRGSVEPIKRRA